MNRNSLVLIVTLLFIFMSCATPGTSRSTPPDFFRNPPVEKGLIFGLGSGRNLEQAMAAAHRDIAGQVGVSITSTMELKNKETDVDGEVSSSSSVESRSSHSVNTILESSKRLEYELTDDGTHYVLVFYPEDRSVEYDEVAIIDEIREDQRKRLVTTTVFSSVLPGTGQLMNDRTVKGAVLLGTAIGFMGVGTFGFVDSAIQYQNALDAPNREMQAYYEDLSDTSLIIGAVGAGLYVLEAVFSGIDNYAANRR